MRSRTPSARRSVAALAVTLVLVVGLPTLSGSGSTASEASSSRIVAVGDVHGELDGFRDLLGEAGLIDGTGRWTGGATTLVQLGDTLDRGPQVRGAMDLLMRLQEEAGKQGGEVVVLLGNHEQMNLLTIYRDVSPAALETFADAESETRRRRAYEAWVRWEKDLADEDEGTETDGSEPGSAEHRDRWLDEHPPGWLEYHAALGPRGKYGAWLRQRPVAVVRGGVLFMHAGLSPEYADRSVEEINRIHEEAFEGFDRVRRYLVNRGLAPAAATYQDFNRTLVALGEREEPTPEVSPLILRSLAQDFYGLGWMMEADSPLWFRGYAEWPDEELQPLIDRIRRSHGIERLAAGHSPVESASIHVRLEDRVFLIDTGMLTQVYDGRASALEIDGRRITAIYPDERRVLVDGPEVPPARVFRTPDGEILPLEREPEILDFLRKAHVTESRLLGLGVTGARLLVLERAGARFRAVFHDIDREERGPIRIGGKTTMYFRDSHRSQIAAYELSSLMGLNRVPPTVPRTVDGQRGSVQLWIEDGIMWQTIQEEDLEVPNRTYLLRQMYDLRVFDNLIHNTDRNQGNILFDPDWNLWWIDNTRSFTLHKELVAPNLVQRCSRGLWRSLRDLDEKTARERLGPVLSIYQIKALLARRDRLVELLEQKIDQSGEDRVLFDYGDPSDAVKVSYEEARAVP